MTFVSYFVVDCNIKTYHKHHIMHTHIAFDNFKVRTTLNWAEKKHLIQKLVFMRKKWTAVWIRFESKKLDGFWWISWRKFCLNTRGGQNIINKLLEIWKKTPKQNVLSMFKQCQHDVFKADFALKFMSFSISQTHQK